MSIVEEEFEERLPIQAHLSLLPSFHHHLRFLLNYGPSVVINRNNHTLSSPKALETISPHYFSASWEHQRESHVQLEWWLKATLHVSPILHQQNQIFDDSVCPPTYSTL